jgi:uncharacterized protein YjeT (DUF2065 family)
MRQQSLLYYFVMIIAAITVVSGLVQMVAPRFVLRMVGAQITPTSAHFFGIVGMFMLLFGGALLHEVFSTPAQPVIALWAALQKFGAVAAVILGVLRGLFSPLALLVSSFDLVSAVIIIAYWSRIRKTA